MSAFTRDIINRMRGQQITADDAEQIGKQLAAITRLPREVYILRHVEDHGQGFTKGAYPTLEKALQSIAEEHPEIVLVGGDATNTWELYRTATIADRRNRWTRVENGLVFLWLEIERHEVSA